MKKFIANWFQMIGGVVLGWAALDFTPIIPTEVTTLTYILLGVSLIMIALSYYFKFVEPSRKADTYDPVTITKVGETEWKVVEPKYEKTQRELENYQMRY